MTFPIKADIEFFKEAKRIQELWEPQEGDWCVTRCGKAYFLVRTVTDNAFYVRSGSHKVRLELTTDDVEWLPHQGQLQEMLEERGYCWGVETSSSDDYLGIASPRRPLDSLLNSDDVIFKCGPTPSIALGKCLLEVLGD